ncbi:MAG: ATP-binding protein [Bdellovibrionaceae bacterium]|nr:ATP-binding protein [Pseudobdellovibrionaceae bacterium]
MLERDVFAKFSLKVDKFRSQKRLVLGNGLENESLPYMVWSAGQREFVPLLLGFYWLMPPSAVSRRGDINWVVLEELEMGLHPKAISVALLLVFELLKRGYKVCLSTHSTQVLDAMWALKHLKEHKAKPEVLLDIFSAPTTANMIKMAEAVMRKHVRVHYFDRESGITRDISQLDPDSEATGNFGWGGLSEFSGRANDAVARAVAKREKITRMTFQKAVDKIPQLNGAFKAGMEALRSRDASHINAEDTRKICGSIDLDAAYTPVDPHGNRWDYGIAYQHINRRKEVVYWVETHTADTSEFKVVIRKARWLLNWLKADGRPAATLERDIYWVASGATKLSLGAPQRRQMAEVGLQYAGSVLRIRNRR